MDNKSRRVNRKYDSSLQLANVIGAGANKIKKQIRNIERLLQKRRDTLPDTVIIEKERTLEALKFELKDAELRQLGRKNAKKYHMVRFFEHKKALRRYKQSLKKLESNPGDKTLKKALEQATVDLCYVVNFPRLSKYIALYPTSNEASSNSKETEKGMLATDTKRNEFRDMISKQLKEGTLPVSLEEILQGKRLNKDSTGVMLEEEQAKEEEIERDYSEDKDDFFE